MAKKNPRYKFDLRQRVVIVNHLGRLGMVVKRRCRRGLGRDVSEYLVEQDDHEGTEWWPEMSLAPTRLEKPARKGRVSRRVTKLDEVKMLAWRRFRALGEEPPEYAVREVLDDLMESPLHRDRVMQTAAVLSGLWAASQMDKEDEVKDQLHWRCKGAANLRVVYMHARGAGVDAVERRFRAYREKHPEK